MPVHPGNLTSAYRRIWPEANYTGHDWDDVLGMYYAKARFYDPAAKRFVAMDPVKGNVTDPLSLVSYLYCVDNPLKYVDPMGLSVMPIGGLTPVNNLGTDKVAEAIKNSYNTSITSAKEAINSITKHFTDEDRAGHVMMGIAVSMAKAMLDNAELPILFVLDLVNSLTKSKFTMEYYERYMKGSDALVAKIAENVVYEDSFYFGKMLGDIGLMGLGIGVGIKGIVEILSGLGIGFSGGAGGAALVASGAGAPAGVGLIAGSLTEAGVLIAEGGVSLSIGLALAKTGAGEFGKDKKQFDYFTKQSCGKSSTSSPSAKKVRPESGITGRKKHGVNWTEGPARAKSTGTPQGQWAQSDLEYATEMANKLLPGESRYFDLPEGSKSIVHMPDGTTQYATRMWIRNNGTGTWHGYPMP